MTTWPAPDLHDLKLISHPETKRVAAALRQYHERGTVTPTTAAQTVIAYYAAAETS